MPARRLLAFPPPAPPSACSAASMRCAGPRPVANAPSQASMFAMDDGWAWGPMSCVPSARLVLQRYRCDRREGGRSFYEAIKSSRLVRANWRSCASLSAHTHVELRARESRACFARASADWNRGAAPEHEVRACLGGAPVGHRPVVSAVPEPCEALHSCARAKSSGNCLATSRSRWRHTR